MPDLNPITAWRRMLAAPNDSRGKMLAMAFLVSAASALAVSSAAVLLGPRLDSNRAAERQARLEALLADLPALADLLAETGADGLDIVVADLETGTRADVDPSAFDPEALDEEQISALPPEEDIAGIGTRPDLAQFYVARDGSDIAAVILPVYGQGYQSVIRGYLALEGDLNTVAGLTITEQGETPGLGANIESPSWQAQWPGTQLLGPDGEIRVAVVRGGAQNEYEVDAITGATRTSNGVQNMVRFWIGPEGFGPVLDALGEGRL
ncbi:NADH:ubiquinone reductase (Na(+)-transporting) subunit C [Histidinibacterium aquaticum]|uniref:Na(+)-translocating NADH-quinone reductase subunit C n=1 Tax=Histidinibacterium aquaticum TaxID=2613962 RepID=A0A5J5GPP8_9RHOB|nr:NADH:ubiquinone reductase (Na(+)-transporting) subunit C [Histidinibacterium aquaticum]KAA9009412.1 NADH:ubiquinone reductase (Na(+)-transporting) subunit C [Histidinibacterium aquaticum]